VDIGVLLSVLARFKPIGGGMMRKFYWMLLVLLAFSVYAEDGMLVAVGSAREFVKLQVQAVGSKRTHNYG